ncbi:MAG: recombination mediator RecR [Syntrophaceticus sp.]
MQLYPSSLAVLIESLKKLPGIGAKTAQRLAIHLLHAPKGEAEGLARAILDAREKIFFCSVCGNLTDKDPCDLCRDERRDQSLLCVVEWPRDIIAFERTREFPGVYHVIHGVISPMDGIGPDDLKINELLQRASKESIKEVVIATNPNVEGEATALYLAQLLKPLVGKVTRIAHGLPVGGDLEFADTATLSRSLLERREL